MLTKPHRADTISNVAWKRAVDLCALAFWDAPISSAVKAVEIMRIRVADAVHLTGEQFPFEVSEEFAPQTYAERTVSFSEPVKVSGTYVYDSKAFTVSGRVETSVNSICALCTKEFVEPVEFTFTERFTRDESETDDETYPYSGDELVLDKAVLDNLFLQLSIASVCSENCKGLCPVCGVDRNVTECNCLTQ